MSMPKKFERKAADLFAAETGLSRWLFWRADEFTKAAWLQRAGWKPSEPLHWCGICESEGE